MNRSNILPSSPVDPDAETEHFDVIIVGAGLSGIGAAYRLHSLCPGKTYCILEGRSASGGTWDLFRYPGIRSDSDMFTLGYPFRPWQDSRGIADGPSILRYIRETASEYGIDRHIRYDQKVRGAEWDSPRATWSVAVEGESGSKTLTCSFLYLCAGYYSYEAGHMPDFPGAADFQGTLVHPQAWPEDLDYRDKRVVIIGSGATAVTLLPAMAESAAHVTMLQRSPSYVASLPAIDPVSSILRRFLPDRVNARLSRWRSLVMTTAFYEFCRRQPDRARRLLLSGVTRQLPPGYRIDPHFSPAYNPWDQRMCMVPDGDLFKAVSAGKASVVTDRISSLTPGGIRLAGGEELPADVIVSATGLELVPCGGIQLRVDGYEVTPGETWLYRGCLLSDVPNLAICLGYTNASWTLRADLSSRYVCALIRYMDRQGYVRATPRHRETEGVAAPLLDLTSNYIQRAAAILPKQGAHRPWRLRQNYLLDLIDFKRADVTESMEFARADLYADVALSAATGPATGVGGPG